MGPSFTVKLTPQPGFFVVVKICSFCKRRARRSKIIETHRMVSVPHVRFHQPGSGDWRLAGKICFRATFKQVSARVWKKTVSNCCTREHELVCGRVIRNHWTFDKRGVHKNFFVIVHVPSLGKHHWTTIDNVVSQLDSKIRVGQFVRPRLQVTDELFRVTSVDLMPRLVQITPINGGMVFSVKPETVKWISPILALAHMSD